VRLARHEGAYAVHRVGGDAPAQPEAADQLAVIHRHPAEGGFGHPGAAAEFGDVAQQSLTHEEPSQS